MGDQDNDTLSQLMEKYKNTTIQYIYAKSNDLDYIKYELLLASLKIQIDTAINENPFLKLISQLKNFGFI